MFYQIMRYIDIDGDKGSEVVDGVLPIKADSLEEAEACLDCLEEEFFDERYYISWNTLWDQEDVWEEVDMHTFYNTSAPRRQHSEYYCELIPEEEVNPIYEDHYLYDGFEYYKGKPKFGF